MPQPQTISPVSRRISEARENAGRSTVTSPIWCVVKDSFRLDLGRFVDGRLLQPEMTERIFPDQQDQRYMTSSKNQGQHESEHESRLDKARASEKPLVGTPITSKSDSEIQQRVQERLALKAFRLTKDGQNQFTLTMDDGSGIVDRRKLASDASTQSADNKRGLTLTPTSRVFLAGEVSNDAPEAVVPEPAEKATLREIASRGKHDEKSTEGRLHAWAEACLKEFEKNPPEAGHEQERAAEIKALHDFEKNIVDFRKRAGVDNLSEKEVEATLKQIERLAVEKASTVLPDLDRIMLTSQVMRNAAHPSFIDQGQHNTCNVTSVEARTYTKTPSDAAKLVTDLALSGTYNTRQSFKHRMAACHPWM